MKNYMSEKPCCACGLWREGEVTYHHIYTRKSRPDLKEEKWNLMPLCHYDHITVHQKGLGYLSKIRSVKDWLIKNGWQYESFSGKWLHKGASNARA
jgi:hypothetical protein